MFYDISLQGKAQTYVLYGLKLQLTVRNCANLTSKSIEIFTPYNMVMPESVNSEVKGITS